MILSHSGSNHILEVVASDIHVTIKRRKEASLTSDVLKTQASKVEVWGKIKKLDICGIRCGDVIEGDYVLKETAPLFFEQSDYIINAKSLSGVPLHFDHADKYLREAVSPDYEEELERISGVINFGNNVGFSNLIFYDDNGNSLLIEIEVFPAKMSYKDDYESMRDEINEMVEAAAIAFIKSTYSFTEPSKIKENTPAIFYALISQLFDKYYKATKVIMQKPNHKLIKEHIVLPMYKVKRVDRKSLQWIKKHPDNIINDNGKISILCTQAVRKKITYDTTENQIVKFMLVRTTKKLTQFKRRYLSGFKNPEKSADPVIIKEIDEMNSKLSDQLKNPIFNQVATLSSLNTMSLVFQMAPGYREMYRYYQLIQRGISFSGDVFRLSLKETSLLYEYWCFIKLVNILRSHNDRYALLDDSDEIIKANRKGVTVSLSKNTHSTVKFIDKRTGDRIDLVYNPGEYQSETTKQIPDNVLKLEKKSNHEGKYSQYQYIFDAKYKVEMNPDEHYPDEDGKPGPKVEDINAMHRYRDAIVSKSGSQNEKVMVGAYILFPYPNEEQEYRGHHFYKSIETVNIGGVPFLPGKTQMAEELLAKLIGESDVTAFERIILPKGVEERLAKVDWSKKDVLVGSLSSIEQWEDCYNNNYYYVPYDKKNNYHNVNYIAIYQSWKFFRNEAGILYYGEVSDVQRTVRKEINIIPGNMKPDTECVRFQIKEWKKLDAKIEFEAAYVYNQRFTNSFLLHNCKRTFELFNIRNKEDYRLVYELRRIQKDIRVQDKPKELFVRISENITLYNDGFNIRVFVSDNECIKVSTELFKQRTSDIFERIKNCIG